MADILVTNQPWYYKDDGKWRFGVRGGSRWPHTLEKPGGYKPFPFYLATTDAFLKDNGVDSKFLDAIAKKWTYKQFYNYVDKIKPEFVLLETSTPSIDIDLKIAESLNNRGIKVILGGTHSTIFAEELIQKDFIFAIVKGEMEKPVLSVIENNESRIYSYDIFDDLDKLPEPTRPESMWVYKERTHGYIPRQVNLMSSRGCPFNCVFCQWPKVYNNEMFRQRSPENIEAEIANLVDRFGRDIFLYFDDDTFNIGDERSKKIANIIDSYGLKWSAMCRVDTLKKETWKYLYERGLVAVNFGIETASQEGLNKIGKNLDIEKAREIIEYLNDLGMYVHLTFTHGFPGEKEEDFEKTKKFYELLDVQSKQESRCIAMPGTRMWKNMTEKERKEFNYDGLQGLEKRLSESYSKNYYEVHE